MKSKNTTSTRFKYLDVISVLFVATLIISNIGSTKIIGIGPIVFDGGTILFPLAYILGDVLTEVYGFRKARRVILMGLGVLLLSSIIFTIIQYLPAASGLEDQAVAYERIAGFIPRIVGASILAYVIGEFVNAFILAKLKVKTAGKKFWLRSISSSAAGQLLDTIIFSVIAFWGTLPNKDLFTLIVTVYVLKIIFELLVLPITYAVVGYLKRAEESDVYETEFSLLR